MTTVYRLPHAETLGNSLTMTGLEHWELEEEYPYDAIRDSTIEGVYSICECRFLHPVLKTIQVWYLIAIQNYYPYPFKVNGSKYREIVYYLCSQVVDPVKATMEHHEHYTVDCQ